jgi:hypothetical protein
MKPTTRKQVKNGLRIGLGAGAFLVGAMFLGSGAERVVWSAVPPHHVVWREPVGWAELAAGTALLLASAQVWWQLLAGCMLFGFGHSIIALITGTNVFSPYEPIPHLAAFELIVFCFASLLLMLRFAKGTMSVLDRIALTLFVFSFVLPGDKGGFSAAIPWLAGGLVLLAIAWCMHRWKPHRKHTTPHHVVTTQSTHS